MNTHFCNTLSHDLFRSKNVFGKLSTLLGGVFLDRTNFLKKIGLSSETGIIIQRVESKWKIFEESVVLDVEGRC